MTQFLNFPIHVNIYVTLKCNLNCTHCIDDAGMENKNNIYEMKDQEIYALFDYLLENGVREVSFSGGEPLLRESIFDFIKYLSTKKCKTTLLSNLILLDEKKLKKLQDAGVHYIRTSLEGADKETHDSIRGQGNFDLLLKSFSLLKQLIYVKKGVSVTIRKNNQDQLDKIAELIRQYDFTELTISLLMPSGRGKNLADLMLSRQEFKDFLDYLEDFKKNNQDLNIHFETPLYALYYYQKNNPVYKEHYPCLIGRSFLGFKANGDIYACPMRDEVVIGNIKKDNIYDVWHNSKILNEIRDLNNLKGKCKECNLKLNCGGGCRAFAYIKKSDFTSPDPYCWK